MAKELKMMVGIPGSGKSTWAIAEKERLQNEGKMVAYISRDEIRFSLVEDNEDYFSREKEVFNKFIQVTQAALNSLDKDVVIIDATHISPASRRKVLNRLNSLSDICLTLEVMDVPTSICLERNASREGRAKVPDFAILNMAENFEVPHDEFKNNNYGFKTVTVNIYSYKKE